MQSQMGQLTWPVSFLPLWYVSFISATSLTDRNRLRIQQIYSTIFQHLLPPKERPSSTNWGSIWALRLKIWWMHFNGGMRSAKHIPGSTAWHWITLVSQVCYFHVILCAIYSLNYIATSVEVERLFSRRRLVLSHTWSRLSVASTHALICLGSWSHLGLVRDEDLEAVVNLNEVEGVMELNKLSAILRAKLE